MARQSSPQQSPKSGASRVYPVPPMAIRLLRWCAPKSVVEHLLGDLEEEFHSRCGKNAGAARAWFWRQAVHSSAIYLKQQLVSSVVLRPLVLIVSVSLLILSFQLIAWLALADSQEKFSPNFWHTLSSGHIHMVLLEPAFWQQLPETLMAVETPLFLVDLPALGWSAISLALLLYCNRQFRLSWRQLVCAGGAMVFGPYLAGLWYISSHALAASQIGPVLAMMLCNVLYLTLPVALLIRHRLKAPETNAL